MTDAPYGGQSTTDAAKEQAGQVGQTAKDSGQKVAGTAAEQGKNVLEEGKTQVRNLHGEVRQQVTEQSTAQKDKAVTGLRSLADELQGMADGQQGQSGVAADLATQASTKAHEFASWLDDRDPGSLLEEVRNIARRKPGAFLLGAVAAGVLAGRMTRGAVDSAKSDSGSTTDGAGAATGFATAPVSTGYQVPVAPSTTADAFPGSTVAGTAAHEGETVDPAITLPGDTVSGSSNDYSGTSVGGYR